MNNNNDYANAKFMMMSMAIMKLIILERTIILMLSNNDWSNNNKYIYDTIYKLCKYNEKLFNFKSSIPPLLLLCWTPESMWRLHMSSVTYHFQSMTTAASLECLLYTVQPLRELQVYAKAYGGIKIWRGECGLWSWHTHIGLLPTLYFKIIFLI